MTSGATMSIKEKKQEQVHIFPKKSLVFFSLSNSWFLSQAELDERHKD